MASKGKYFFFCSSFPNLIMTLLTKEFWISTKTATAGSTLATSSMHKMVVKKLQPAPPYSVSISIPNNWIKEIKYFKLISN